MPSAHEGGVNICRSIIRNAGITAIPRRPTRHCRAITQSAKHTATSFVDAIFINSRCISQAAYIFRAHVSRRAILSHTQMLLARSQEVLRRIRQFSAILSRFDFVICSIQPSRIEMQTWAKCQELDGAGAPNNGRHQRRGLRRAPEKGHFAPIIRLVIPSSWTP